VTEFLVETDSDIQTTKRKWSVYRLTREDYQRLFDKKRRGEKINFRERGNRHCFTSTMHAPTGEEIRAFCGDGYYVTEHLFDGVAGDWSFAAIVPSQDVVLPEQSAAAQTAPVVQASTASQSEPSSARSINDTTETIRATKELLKEVAPQQQPASLTNEQLEQMLERVAAKHFAQAQSAQSQAAPQPDQFAMLDRAIGLVEKMRPAQPARAESSPESAIDSALKIVEKLADASERVNPSGEGGGVINGVARLIEAFGIKEIIKPIGQAVVGPMIAGAMQARAQSSPQAQALPEVAPDAATTPAPPPQQPTPEQFFSMTLGYVVDRLKKGKRSASAADAIEELLQKYPQYVGQLNTLLSLPDDVLLSQLSAMAGEDLSGYTGALDFIADLKDDLQPDDEASDAAELAPVDPSRNGSNSHAAINPS
jgi:hypothetical protein